MIIEFQQKKKEKKNKGKKKETRKGNCVNLWIGFHDLFSLIAMSCIFVNEPV